MLKRVALLLVVCTLSLTAVQAQQTRPTPYMASIASGRAMMRTGPGENYPGIWLYVRRDLPVRVVRVYDNWREIEDPGGTRGWMRVQLLADRRTGIVVGEGLAPLHESPEEGSNVRFRAEPNVVGRVSRCRDGWCWFDVSGRAGYIQVGRLWGVDAGEAIR